MQDPTGSEGTRLLLVPVVFSEVDDDRHEHWEGLVLVGLQDG